MPTRDSGTVSIRLKNDDIAKLKATGITATQIIKRYLDGEFEKEVDTDRFVAACKRRGRKPQEIIDMVTEQLLSS